ncbi:cation:proton antiporter [Sphingomonas quercus]|uniref:Cation:proton antiporter n=1 Tax=Sphingomonas quercus TaxID=2842451 RepID=A0ABS6BIT1_9SPHN|nr:cation:proton antiporter [Sphingomonas quercus]MBU3077742.1 cation:proton antiporter [Sphingomonas quercus]
MAGSVHQTELLLASVLLQLIVMIGAARIGNSLFRRMGQPGAVGEIVAGLTLGPSLFGYLFPQASVALFGATPQPAVTVLSQIGLVLLMFQIGCGFEFGQLGSARLRRATLFVAIPSIAVPFALGFGIGIVSAASLAPGMDRLIYSLFCGIALAITAVPVLGRILVEYRLAGDELGVVAISAAAINDVVGWVLLALISAYATATLTGAHAALSLGALALFMLLLRWPLMPLADRLVARMPVRDGTIPPNLLAVLLCLAFVLAICTFRLGIFAIFGGFAAGLLFHRHRALAEAWQRQVGGFVLVFFLPIFFTFTGLRTNLLGLTVADIGWLFVVVVAAIGGKILPVYLAARASGYAPRPALTLGALMNTRALMELIVLNIGRELGFLPPTMFTMLVVMAVVTTLMTGPLLRLLLPRAHLADRTRVDA